MNPDVARPPPSLAHLTPRGRQLIPSGPSVGARKLVGCDRLVTRERRRSSLSKRGGNPLERLSSAILGLLGAPGRRADEFADGLAKPQRETRVDLLGLAE